MNTVQILEHNGKPAFVVMPFAEYERMLEPFEDAKDAARIEQMLNAVASGAEEVFPAALVDALVLGGNPVRLLREYRGMSTGDLAAACNVTKAHIYQLETGKRSMSVDLLRKLTHALTVEADILL